MRNHERFLHQVTGQAVWGLAMTYRNAFRVSVHLLLAGLICLSSCSRQSSSGSPTGEVRALTIVSPHNLHVKRELGGAFSDWYRERTGGTVVVDWLDQGGTSRSIRFAISQFERTPSGIGVDLFFGGGIDPYLRFSSLGLLEPCILPDEILSALPASISGVPMRDPEGVWYGVAISTFGILINEAVIARCNLPSVTTWRDLTAPEVYGWVAAADPRRGGVGHIIFEIILQALGWEEGWATIVKLAGNSRYFTRFSSQIGKDVLTGEAAYGLLIDFYATAQLERAPPGVIRFVIPDGLSIISPDSIGILKGAPEPDLAQQFLQFLLSPEGQRLWIFAPGEPGGPQSQALHRLPILPTIYEELREAGHVVASPYDVKGTIEYDHKRGGERWAILDDLVGAAILDHHGLIRKTWRHLIENGLPPDLVQRFVRPPVTEMELIRLADEEWKDPLRRASVMSRWTNQMRENLQAILSSKEGS